MKSIFSKERFVTVLAAFAVLAGAVIRCILLSGAVPAAESNDLSLCFYICFAASVLLFAASSFMLFSGKTDTVGPSPESGMFLPCISGAAGVFCDFIYQCLSCYDYVSRTAYPAANRIVPMIACAVFALLGCAYFIVLSICSRSRSFDLGRLRLLCFAPFLWALCHVLLGLTEYESAYNDTESALKYITLIFGLLFFFLLAAQKEDVKANGSLAFFGFAYSAVCFVSAVPRIIAYAFGAQLPQAGYFSVSFLLVGVFAFAAAAEISFKKKV